MLPNFLILEKNPLILIRFLNLDSVFIIVTLSAVIRYRNLNFHKQKYNLSYTLNFIKLLKFLRESMKV